MLASVGELSWADALDILFLCVVGYHLVIWFRGTKAFRALIGLVAMAAVYSLARSWGLFLTTWVFQVLWQVLVILILILFQHEIRQVLERLNPLRPFARSDAASRSVVETVGRLAREAAQRGWGALVVVLRRDALPDLPGEGLPVGAALSLELLISIFNPTSPTHDGAVIVEGETIARTGTIMPLSARQNLPSRFGTRHRAALGISETCDAVAVIVSEETGSVGLAVGGKFEDLGLGEDLEARLNALTRPADEVRPGLMTRLGRLVVKNWKTKLAVLFLVCSVWLILAGQQNFSSSVKAQVSYIGLQPDLKVAELSDREVTISVIGPRRQAAALSPDEVRIVVNLSGYLAGTHQIGLIRQNIQIPIGLEVGGISPRMVVVTLNKRTEQ